MDEYISKTKFEELMLEKARCSFDLYYTCESEHYRDDAIGYNMAANEAHVFPSTDVQPVDRWVSVDDRLPNVDERVFVYIPRPDNHYNTEIAYISYGNDDYPYWVLRDKSQFYSTRFHYISHWMPLPEPPKEGDTE